MKTDTYTKIVLTVIAICLLCLVSKTFDSGIGVTTANAQDNPIPIPRVIDVNIVSIDGQNFSPGQIQIGRVALPMNITGIGGQSFSPGQVQLGSVALPIKNVGN